jgi:hypothetical protein
MEAPVVHRGNTMIADKNPSLDIPRAILRIADCGMRIPSAKAFELANPQSAIRIPQSSISRL